MTGTTTLELPADAAAAIAQETARFGARPLETGGFLLALEGTERVAMIAFAGTRGIVRQFGLFQVSEMALDRLFGYADRQGLWIPAQFHSHRFGDGLSPTDRIHGLRVPGFISSVVPNYAKPSCDPADWGWWRFEHGAWGRIERATTVDGTVALVIFDEDDVRAC